MLRTLQNDGMRYWTGRLKDGRQLIVGPALPNIHIYLFDSEGKFVEKQVVGLNPKPTWDASKHVYITDDPFLAAMEAQIASIQESLGSTPQTIQIQDFYDEKEDAGIKELPSEFEEYLDDPGRYSAEDRRSLETAIKEWREKQRFVFVWGIELWISSDGERLTS